MAQDEAAPASPEVEVESGRRLSESVLWKLQRSFYDRSGVAAWNTGTVPHYITNNPVIARAYFRVVLGYLRDLEREGRLDSSQPVYVVEPGAGSGRFGFQFLKALYEHDGASPLDRVKLCYVMADFTRSNLEFWGQHPQLRPFVEAGHLDFALLDVENHQETRLEHSGARLGAGDLRNPVVVVGNYLFDTLTQDAFQVVGGELHECLARVVSDRPEDLEAGDEGLLGRLTVRYDMRKVEGPYYGRADWDRLLDTYRQRLGDTSLCLPVGALRCIDNLLALSGGRLLMIISDKGWSRLDELTGLDQPTPVLHGESFSMTVNFHALGMHFENLGGVAMHAGVRDAMLDTGVYLLDPEVPSAGETRLAFREFVDGFGPIDFFNLKESLLASLPKPGLRLALDFLRLSGWDPEVFYVLSDAMAEQVESASLTVCRELDVAVERIWTSYYHIGSDRDVPFELARMCYRLEHYDDALRFYDLSLKLFGDHKMTLHNMALCHYYSRRMDDALEFFGRALELDPGYGSARNWVVRIQGERESREHAAVRPA